MLLKRIVRHIDLKALKEETRKMGTNFVTAGIVGVFINHYVGSKLSTMFWTSMWITVAGAICLFLGVVRRVK